MWRLKGRRMDGIFSIDKARGMTSHDVVARVRRLTRQKRVGHAGTLDPAAEGVLPICLGQATRVAEYLSDRGKAYRATIHFGVVTDTYDAEGQIVRESSALPTLEQIAAALPAFLGEQMQVPPIYSALKRGGRKLYELARAGETIEIEPRPVRIDALTIVDWQPPNLVLERHMRQGHVYPLVGLRSRRALGVGRSPCCADPHAQRSLYTRTVHYLGATRSGARRWRLARSALCTRRSAAGVAGRHSGCDERDAHDPRAGFGLRRRASVGRSENARQRRVAASLLRRRSLSGYSALG